MTIDTEINAQPTKLDLMKEHASRLNITFHPNIKEEKLQIKIDEFLASAETLPTVDTADEEAKAKKLNDDKLAKIDLTEKGVLTETLKENQIRRRREAQRLVRVRIACMNPNKKDWTGEILTVSNNLVGSLKKYIPFNNDEGWHIPYMMFLHLKERECQIFIKEKARNGMMIAKGKLIKEFNVELMEPLTSEELKALATRQAMAKGEAA